MSREWSTFVITGLGKNSPRRFHGGGDTAACEHGPGVKIRQTRRLGGSSRSQAAGESWGGTGGMGADVRKYGTEHPKPGSEPSSHQLNNNQTYEGGPAVALYLRHYSYSWPSGTTKKPRKLGTFLSCQKSKFGNCPSRTDHEPHQ